MDLCLGTFERIGTASNRIKMLATAPFVKHDLLNTQSLCRIGYSKDVPRKLDRSRRGTENSSARLHSMLCIGDEEIGHRS